MKSHLSENFYSHEMFLACDIQIYLGVENVKGSIWSRNLDLSNELLKVELPL